MDAYDYVLRDAFVYNLRDRDWVWRTVPAGAACILSVCRFFLGIFHSWIYGYLLS